MKFIPKGRATVRLDDHNTNIQCIGLLKKGQCDLLVGDGVLVARYDAVKAQDGVEKNVVVEEVIGPNWNLILDPANSPYAAEWPSPAVAKPARSSATKPATPAVPKP